MRNKQTGYMTIATMCEEDMDITGWRSAILKQALGGPEFLPVEIDVSELFYLQLLDSIAECMARGGDIKIYGISIVVRENLPFAEEIAA